jgi:hypothetical protein
MSEMPAEHTIVSGSLMGCLMKNGIATYGSPHEYYVLQINGQVNSTHRRYQDALIAGLQLKYQFPHDDIKVCVKNPAEDAVQGTVLH